MKTRLLRGWTFNRVLFLTMGGFVLAESIWRMEWVGMVFGGYFAAMGLFGFGCAGGSCAGGGCNNYNKK